MQKLYKTEYTECIKAASQKSPLAANSQLHQTTCSKLDADFSDDEGETLDEIDAYLSEKPVNWGVNVLEWWKVSDEHLLVDKLTWI